MINYKVTGVEEVKAMVSDLPRGTKAAAMRAIATYIVGDERHGLKHYPKYKYVTRKQAGYKTSAKQRRYLFAVGIWKKSALGKGVAVKKYNRTGGYKDSWDWKQQDYHWDRTNITGKLPFDRFPARMNKMGGWRHYMEVVNTNIKGCLLYTSPSPRDRS